LDARSAIYITHDMATQFLFLAISLLDNVVSFQSVDGRRPANR
jgi:hypothetical protein